MNTIKPQWMILGILTVSILWLTELANRPDTIPHYSETMQLKRKALSSMSGKVSDSVKQTMPESGNIQGQAYGALATSGGGAPGGNINKYYQNQVVGAQEQLLQQTPKPPAKTMTAIAGQSYDITSFQNQLAEY